MQTLTVSRRRPSSYRNQSTDLLYKSMDWFLYDNGLRHETAKTAYNNPPKLVLKIWIKKDSKVIVASSHFLHPATLLKEDVKAGVFLWILRIFLVEPFSKTLMGDYLWRLDKWIIHLIRTQNFPKN